MSNKITNLAIPVGPYVTGIAEARSEDISNGIASQELVVISANTEGQCRLVLSSYSEVGTIMNAQLFMTSPTTPVGSTVYRMGLSNTANSQSEILITGRLRTTIQTTAGAISFIPVANRVEFNNTSPYAYKTAGGAWGTLSDSRLKQSIREIGSALDKILTLHPVHFEFINQGENSNPSGTRTGFIAQEFEQVLPGHTFEMDPLLEEDKQLLGDGVKAKGIDADLVPYLVKAIQELSAKVTSLEAQVATLSAAP